jgi:uroporphyrinogen decarboxylase
VLDRPIRSEADVDRLREFEPAEELPYVAESLRLVKDELAGELPLLGFAGAPLTLAAFMIAGGSPGRDIAPTRALMREQPAVMHRLLERLADMTVTYLRMQIDTGADAVQLFESIGDLLEPGEYEAFAHPYHRRIFARLGDAVPRILFVKEQPQLDLMLETGADVLSVGRCIDLEQAMQQYGARVAFQGNVDNELLAAGTFEKIEQATKRCIEAGGHRGHILNLNHGLLRHTPFDNVCRLIDTCRSYRIESIDNAPGDGT